MFSFRCTVLCISTHVTNTIVSIQNSSVFPKNLLLLIVCLHLHFPTIFLCFIFFSYYLWFIKLHDCGAFYHVWKILTYSILILLLLYFLSPHILRLWSHVYLNTSLFSVSFSGSVLSCFYLSLYASILIFQWHSV